MGSLKTDAWVYGIWQNPGKSCQALLCPSEVLEKGGSSAGGGRDVCIKGLICERVLNESQGVSGWRPVRFSVPHFSSPVCRRQAAKRRAQLPPLPAGAAASPAQLAGRKGLPHYSLRGLSLPVQTRELGFTPHFSPDMTDL